MGALFFAGKWAYRRVETQALQRAGKYIEARDYRSAQLTLEQAVQVNPENWKARRALAEFYTEMNLPRALTLWDELGREDPANDGYAMGQAGAALRQKRYDIVDQALARVSAEGRSQATYKRQRAALALMTGDRAGLSRQLEELSVLEPENLRMQFNTAAVAAQSTQLEEAEAARARLVELAQGEKLRIRATLQLLQLAAVQSDPAKAVGMAAANILKLRPGRGAGLFELAEHMKAQPSPTAADAAELIEWMARQDRAREAVLWSGGLPSETQKMPPVRKALAVCAVQMRDWVRLQEQLHAGVWGTMPDGLLELAFAARVQWDGAGRPRALTTWRDTLPLAAGHRNAKGFDVLEKLATIWGWTEARAETLARAHERFPREIVYMRKLAALAEAEGASAQLDKIYEDWTEAYPDDRYPWASRLYLGVLRDDLETAARKKASALINRPDVMPEEAMIWAWVEAEKGPDARTAALTRVEGMIEQIRLRPRGVDSCRIACPGRTSGRSAAELGDRLDLDDQAAGGTDLARSNAHDTGPLGSKAAFLHLKRDGAFLRRLAGLIWNWLRR